MDKIVKAFRFTHSCGNVIEKHDWKTNDYRKSPEWAKIYFLCQFATFTVIHKRGNRGNYYFLTPKKIAKHIMTMIYHTEQYVGSGSDFVTPESSWWKGTEKGHIRKGHKRKIAEPNFGPAKETSLFEGSTAFIRPHKSLVDLCKIIAPYLDRFHPRASKKPFFRFCFWNETHRQCLSKMGFRTSWAKKVNFCSMEARGWGVVKELWGLMIVPDYLEEQIR